MCNSHGHNNEDQLKALAEQVADLLNQIADAGGHVGIGGGQLHAGYGFIRRVGNRWTLSTRR